MSVTNLSGKDVYDKMKNITESTSELFRYFHFDCLLWRAMVNHIALSSIEDCVIIKKEGEVPCHRGTGYAVGFKKCCNYSTQYSQDKNHNTITTEPDVFSIDIEVTYEDEEDENREWCRNYWLRQVPLNLLLDFTQEEFDNWIKKLKLIKDKESKIEDMKQLAKLVEKYPYDVKVLSLILDVTDPKKATIGLYE